MLLIILLGVIGKLAVVSADCDIGTLNLNYTDWTNFTGNWYWLYHIPQEYNENLDCPVSTYEAITKNVGRLTTSVYVKSTQTRERLTATVLDWNTNGYFDFYYPEPSRDTNCSPKESCTKSADYARLWSGRYQVLSVNPGRYNILKFCGRKLNTPIIYVVSTTPKFDEETLNDVKKDLREKGLDFNQLVKLEYKHC